MKITALYDGWPLIHSPFSPAAQHLLTILAFLPEQVEPVIALPGQAPNLRLDIPRRIHLARATPLGRLIWVHRVMPWLARLTRAHLIHLTTPTAPVFGRTASLVSPAGYDLDFGLDNNIEPSYARRQSRNTRRGFIDRVGASLAHGGVVRAQAVLWPSDLPTPKLSVRLIKIPPIVHLGFSIAGDDQVGELRTQLAAVDLPETYVLYHGPADLTTLKHLVDAWSWAAGPIGEYYPLLVLGLDSSGQQCINQLAHALDLGNTLRVIAHRDPALIPAIYLGCTALLHPAPVSPWDGAVRQALACGKPVVAFDEPVTSAMAGPAAYLTTSSDARAMAAALITVVVEEEVANNLSRAAQKRAADWRSNSFAGELSRIYQDMFAAL